MFKSAHKNTDLGAALAHVQWGFVGSEAEVLYAILRVMPEVE